MRYLRMMFAGILGAGLPFAQPRQGHSVDLASMKAQGAIRIDGAELDNRAGRRVSDAGDVNGDGFGDVLISAYAASYLVFGKGSLLNTTPTLQLSELNGLNGCRIQAAVPNGGATIYEVSSAGDVNNDGFDDVLIGVPFPNFFGFDDSGTAFVLFGKESFSSSTIELTSLDGTDGIRINSAAPSGIFATAVAGAGDVNNDGFDDVIIGAARADPNGTDSGSSYVVFGKASFTTSVLEVSSFDGTNGFRINGVDADDRAGCAVSGAGDVNNDGFDDLIIGAYGATRNGSSSGASYVVFGAGSFAPTVELAALSGTNGFSMDGEIFSSFGTSVSGAGDANGDGFADVIVGAPLSGSNRGAGYMIFGKASFTSSGLELSSLNGTNGVRFDGAAIDDIAGQSVSGAGDVDADGFSDVLIGAPNNNFGTGATFVVYGAPSFPDPVFDLAAVDGTNGTGLNGEGGTFSGNSVSGAGDVNNDGISDVIIGAPAADPNGNLTGSSHVVSGAEFAPGPNISKMKISLNFAKPDSDSISLQGFVRLMPGFNPTGQLLSFDVGGVTTTLVLDEKGASKSVSESVKLKYKAGPNGFVDQQTATFKASLKLGNFAASLVDEGLINADLGIPVEIMVRTEFSGRFNKDRVKQIYKAKVGKSGKAK